MRQAEASDAPIKMPQCIGSRIAIGIGIRRTAATDRIQNNHQRSLAHADMNAMDARHVDEKGAGVSSRPVKYAQADRLFGKTHVTG